MIGGAVAAAGAAAMKAKAAADQSDARNSVNAAELTRQQGFENQSAGLFRNGLASTGRGVQEANTAGFAADRAKTATDAINSAPTSINPSNSTGDGTNVVDSANARALVSALNSGRAGATRSAAVNAYGDNTQGVGAALGRIAQNQNMVAGSAQRSSGVLPMELSNANRAGSGLATAGSLLGAAGTAASMAGSMGAGGSFGDLFSNGAPVSATIAGPTQQGFFPRIFSGRGF